MTGIDQLVYEVFVVLRQNLDHGLIESSEFLKLWKKT